MCGRCFNGMNRQAIEQAANAGFEFGNQSYTQHYNIAPTNYLAAIVHNTFQQQQNINKKNIQNCDMVVTISDPDLNIDKKSNRKLGSFYWTWDLPFGPLINCRIEEAHEKKIFKPFLNTNRCVIIVEGYYEWDKEKNPNVIRHKQSKCLFLGGLINDEDRVVVCTTQAVGDPKKVHCRMGLFIDEDEIDDWIDPEIKFVDIYDRIVKRDNKKIIEENMLEVYKAASYVNKVSETSAKCLMSIEEYERNQDKIGIKSFFSNVVGTDNDNNKKNSIGISGGGNFDRKLEQFLEKEKDKEVCQKVDNLKNSIEFPKQNLQKDAKKPVNNILGF